MGTDRGTLLDVAKQTDPNGMPAQIIEVLEEQNPILMDAPAFPANAPMGNRVTLRSSLPDVHYTKVNQGTVRSKSSTEQRVDTMGILVGLSEVDRKMIEVLGEGRYNAYRRGEDLAFAEAMGQRNATTMLYGDELTADAEFTGLAPRLNALATSITGSQVHSAGAVVGGDGTSIYVVDWGERTAHVIYPEGSTAGVKTMNHGKQRVTDAAGNPFMADVTEHILTAGLTVKDPRHIGRLANIDISDANLASPTQGNLIEKLIDLLTPMPNPGGAQRVLYCHHKIEAAWYKQALNKSNAALSIRDYLGKPMLHFWAYPIRRLDRISASETDVS